MRNVKLVSLAGFLIMLSACSSTPPASRSAAGAATKARFAETVIAKTFYKGNIHTHTSKTDGDSTPKTVLNWYKNKGYHFVALTDHDMYTPTPKGVTNSSFITIPGVEITGQAKIDRPGMYPPAIHVNALCVAKKLVGIREAKPVKDVLQENIDLSRASGAVTMVNHPNFGWSINADDLNSADKFELLEIASGHPLVYDKGDGSHPSAEELWDRYLTAKHRVFAAALDDSHHFKKFGSDKSNPGRAWIQVWAPELSEKAICNALRNGYFYSSKGSNIRAIVVTPKTMEVSVSGWQPSTDYVDFIGANGELLSRVTASPAQYALRGGEGYVRAHVVQGADESKREAWTQAYFLVYD